MTTTLIKPYPELCLIHEVETTTFSQTLWILQPVRCLDHSHAQQRMAIPVAECLELPQAISAICIISVPQNHSSQSSFLHVVNEGPEVSFYDFIISFILSVCPSDCEWYAVEKFRFIRILDLYWTVSKRRSASAYHDPSPMTIQELTSRHP
jgi:hypothetical protein